jgi:hypothetical protein
VKRRIFTLTSVSTWLATTASFKIQIRHSTTTLSFYTVPRSVLTLSSNNPHVNTGLDQIRTRGSMVPRLMYLHYFRKFLLIAGVTTDSHSIWIWMEYQETLHTHPFNPLINYEHIQRIPAFIKKKCHYSLLDRR